MDNPPKYPCPALPEGWMRQVVQRRSGLSAGKCDVYYYSPSGEKFRSKYQLGLHLGNALDISRFDYTTGELADEPIKEFKTERNSSPRKRSPVKSATPKSKKDKIIVKFGNKMPISPLDIKTEHDVDNKDSLLDESTDVMIGSPQVSTPNKRKVSSPASAQSQRGRKRKRVSEVIPEKAIKQELLDHELASAEEEFAAPQQRINGHRRSDRASLGIRELQINLNKLPDVKQEHSPESAARTRVARPRSKAGSASPRKKSPEKARSPAKPKKTPAKRGAKSPKKNSSQQVPKALLAEETELQELKKQALKDAVVREYMVKFLKRRGEPSSLHDAVLADDHDIVRMLSCVGVGVNSINSELETPLHLAVRCKSTSMATLLLDASAEVNVPNKDLQTPLHLAVLEGSLELVNLLLLAGASLEAVDVAGQTPLHLASKAPHVDIIKALTEAGGNLEAKTEAGKH